MAPVSNSLPVHPATSGGESRAISKPVWTRPALTVYGDVRELTLGPSPGMGESGNPTALRL